MYIIQRTENAHTNPSADLFRTVSRCKTAKGAWRRLRELRADGGSGPLALAHSSTSRPGVPEANGLSVGCTVRFASSPLRSRR